MEPIERQHSATTVIKTGDAVGMPEKKWFIAVVNNNTEKKCCERLIKMGYESYVPMQQEIHHWCTGKKKPIDRIILPSIIFVHIEESERKEIVSLSFINRFMTNRASGTDKFNRHQIAVIPDHQINTLKFMLYHSESPVSIDSTPIKLGDKVRVIRGQLQGLDGFVSLCNDRSANLSVRIDALGFARVTIALSDVSKI